MASMLTGPTQEKFNKSVVEAQALTAETGEECKILVDQNIELAETYIDIDDEAKPQLMTHYNKHNLEKFGLLIPTFN